MKKIATGLALTSWDYLVFWDPSPLAPTAEGQHGENDVLCHCPSYRSKKASLMTTLLAHPSRSDVNTACLSHGLFWGSASDIFFVFPNPPCGFITHGPVMPFGVSPVFSLNYPSSLRLFANSLLYSESFSSSVLSIWGLSASLPQSLWPVGLQDLLLHEVAVWMLIVSEEFVFKYGFFSIHYSSMINLFSTYWPLSGCQSI